MLDNMFYNGFMGLIVESDSGKCTIADKYTIADTFLTRFLGLMGKRALPPGFALILKPCNSIHTFFMRFPIDVVFLNSENKAIHLIRCIKPWRISRIISNAACVVELPCGLIDSSNIKVGDRIIFS